MGPGHSTSDEFELLQSAFSHLPHGIVVHDERGHIELANPAATELLGIDATRMIGADSLAPEAEISDESGAPLAAEDQPARIALATRRPVRDVFVRLRRPDRRESTWLQISAVPELTADGAVRRILSTLRDATPQRVALEQMGREHALLTQVMRFSAAGITVLDPDGSITYANRAAEEILGLSRDEILSRHYDAPQWHATDLDGGPWPDEKQPFRRVMTTARPVVDVRHAIHWPDGRRKVLSINGGPVLNAQGEIERLVFALVDITENTREAAERERMNRQMEQLTRFESLSVLAGGVAHDFNNILVGILGTAGLLLEDLSADDPNRELADFLQQSALRAEELTKQLLAFSSRGKLALDPVGLTAVIRGMTQLLEALVPKGVRLDLDLERDDGSIEADATQLQQIVMNLVLNSAQALPSTGGSISVQTRTEEVGREELDAAVARADGCAPGVFACLEVRDDGAGMTPEVLDRMFEPFYSTKAEGHGLGLPTVLGVTRSHRGFVHVTSTAGGGTTFRIGFPRQSAPAPVAAAPTPPSPLVLDHTILLVDDEKVVRDVATRALRRRGCEVVTAVDGRDGLDQFTAEPDRFDAVIVDLAMPNLRGDELLRQIHALRPDLPAVVMSGHTEIEPPSSSAHTRFLAKPFQPRTLASTLRAAIEND